MSPADISTVALAVLAGAGIIVGVIRWFFYRGAAERELTIAVRDNTEANRELSKAFSEFRASVTDRFHVHDIRLAEHDGRLHRLEVPLSNGSRSPDRNAGSQG